MQGSSESSRLSQTTRATPSGCLVPSSASTLNLGASATSPNDSNDSPASKKSKITSSSSSLPTSSSVSNLESPLSRLPSTPATRLSVFTTSARAARAARAGSLVGKRARSAVTEFDEKEGDGLESASVSAVASGSITDLNSTTPCKVVAADVPMNGGPPVPVKLAPRALRSKPKALAKETTWMPPRVPLPVQLPVPVAELQVQALEYIRAASLSAEIVVAHISIGIEPVFSGDGPTPSGAARFYAAGAGGGGVLVDMKEFSMLNLEPDLREAINSGHPIAPTILNHLRTALMNLNAGLISSETPLFWIDVSDVAVTAGERADGQSALKTRRQLHGSLADLLFEKPAAEDGKLKVFDACFQGDATDLKKALPPGLQAVVLGTHVLFLRTKNFLVSISSHPIVVGSNSGLSKTVETAKMVGMVLGRPLNLAAFEVPSDYFWKRSYSYEPNYDSNLSLAARVGASTTEILKGFTAAALLLGATYTVTVKGDGSCVAELEHPLPDYTTTPPRLVELIKEHEVTPLNQQDAGKNSAFAIRYDAMIAGGESPTAAAAVIEATREKLSEGSKNTAFAIRYDAMIAGGESPTAAAAVIEATREKMSEAHSFEGRYDAMIKDGESPTAAAAVIEATRKKISEAHSHSATQVNAARFNELILMGFIPSVANGIARAEAKLALKYKLFGPSR